MELSKKELLKLIILGIVIGIIAGIAIGFLLGGYYMNNEWKIYVEQLNQSSSNLIDFKSPFTS